VAQLEIIEQNCASFAHQDELNLAMADCRMKLKRRRRAGAAQRSLREVARSGPRRARRVRVGRLDAGGGKVVSSLEVYRNVLSQFRRERWPRWRRFASPSLSSDGLYSRAEEALKSLPDSGPPSRRFSRSHQPGEHHLENGKYERVLALRPNRAGAYFDATAGAAPVAAPLWAPASWNRRWKKPPRPPSWPRTRRCRRSLAPGRRVRILMNEPLRAAMAYEGRRNEILESLVDGSSGNGGGRVPGLLRARLGR